MKWNYIDKKPYDICHMIEEAILVAGIKYPHQFDKRKNRIIRMISNPSTFDDDDDDDDDDDTSTLEEEDCVLGDEDEVTNAEEETQQSQKQITKPLKIRITYSKTVQVAPLENHNNCNAITQELKKTPETHDLDGHKGGTQRQSHNTTTMGSTKRMSTKHVQVAPPRVKLLSDFSFEKELDGHKQLKKQSHKGFKKMETDRIQHKRIDSDAEKKTPTQCRTESTQSNCNAITRPIHSSAPMQKETQSINEIKKFESSKRKFEERLAEQKTAKRQIVLVDYHDMPKLANDPPATRRCWNRNRKRF
ncbi:hypothetical protein MTR67_003434 [Solanum verrucosum]|uniref:Uncharacterized protein n=1 Tax=Solanum verrucosum TaxID=315347 RepID=A0AAF0PS10_SOLVR|nr:hypothetical protein MTR67_003434 [Solanum verrucosum]